MLTLQRLLYRWKHRNLRLPPRRIIMRNCTATAWDFQIEYVGRTFGVKD